MSMTAYSIIRRALMKCGAIDPTQSITSQEANDGLEMLNIMLAEWFMNSYIKQIDEMDFTITTESFKYSFGICPSTCCNPNDAEMHISDINPLQILNLFSVDANGLPLWNNEITVVNRIDTESYKDNNSILSIPTMASYQYGDQTGTSYLHFVSKFSTPASFKMFYLKPHTEISGADLHNEIRLPPQHYNTLILDLASRLASDYGGQLSQIDSIQLEKSRKDLMNLRSGPIPLAKFDISVSTIGRSANTLGQRYSGRLF